MKLLNRKDQPAETDEYYEDRPEPDEVIEPQPERYEPTHPDPGLRDLSKRDYVAVFKRAFKRFTGDNMTNIAAALAYYAFLAIPSLLLVAVGVFSLVAGPHTISTVIDKLGTVMPGQATTLLEQSLTTTAVSKPFSDSSAPCNAGSKLGGWERSQAENPILLFAPRASRSFALRSTSSRSRPSRNSWSPRAAIWRASERPMPLVAPRKTAFTPGHRRAAPTARCAASAPGPSACGSPSTREAAAPSP